MIHSWRIDRSRINFPFTPVPNQLLEDRRLSYKAKAIWSYLASRPQGWQTSERDLAAQGTDGRDAIRAGLIELENTGWLSRSRARTDDGRLGSMVYSLVIPENQGRETLGRKSRPKMETLKRTTAPEKQAHEDNSESKVETLNADPPALDKPAMEDPALEKPALENHLTNKNDPNKIDQPNTEDPKTNGARRRQGDPDFEAFLVEITNEWNAMAADNGLPQILAFGESRKTSARARWKEKVFKEVWVQALWEVPENPFNIGMNDRGWKASIDWFLRPGKAVAIFEELKARDGASRARGGAREVHQGDKRGGFTI